jgi:Cof subfamily protein (haloacid dehalogenase superfamily)
MKYKAIILDLDDTTVLHGKENLPSKRVKEAIKKAKERIHVSIATARILHDALPVMEHLSLTGPCVLTNGTQIYDPIQKKVISEVKLPENILQKVRSLAVQHNLRTIVYDGDKDIEYTGGTEPKKSLSVYIPEIDIQKVDDLVKIFSIDPAIHVQKLSAWNREYMGLDITSSSASKLHGIVAVSKILHIQTEEIIGVGDGYNDFPLLMACGLKIAMGNAVPELKAIADFVAPTVYEDGVAVVIEKFIL